MVARHMLFLEEAGCFSGLRGSPSGLGEPQSQMGVPHNVPKRCASSWGRRSAVPACLAHTSSDTGKKTHVVIVSGLHLNALSVQ